MVLVDIGEVRQGLEEAVEMIRSPMLILSADLRVNKANDAFYQQFKVHRRETVGRSIFTLGNGQWDIPRLRTLLESVLPENHKVEDFRVEHDFPGIGRRKFSFSARSLYQKSKGTHYLMVLIEEVDD